MLAFLVTATDAEKFDAWLPTKLGNELAQPVGTVLTREYVEFPSKWRMCAQSNQNRSSFGLRRIVWPASGHQSFRKKALTRIFSLSKYLADNK